ncbi:VirB3 family type IV secretion system protein [Paraburkholderia unamae]|uniref:Type IV secretion system protein VirB3 n=1 Tax=Paraburkholderia unamae TaxID=219649 RepID=A0ABX5KS96_9BURK|nr:VirB3 family type IV secretion system protein [Paraburkholderia unamae]PVX85752.1 type IV secretion system protein VirB3 [Paraburkholderia unamae]CAG9254970.1 Type IV secretion system protein VirB3 [Paraburkholderia unamae]
MSARERSKVSRSLSLPRQIGGADRLLAMGNGFVTVLLCYACSMDPVSCACFIALGAAIHFFLRWMSSRDPWWRLVMLVYNRYPDVHEPTPAHRVSARFQRPYGFDQDLSC